MYSNPLLFSSGPNAIVESKSLISSMLYTCAQDSQFTPYCVTEERFPVGHILLIERAPWPACTKVRQIPGLGSSQAAC